MYKTSSEYLENWKKITNSLGLKYRFVPASGYKFDEEEGAYVEKSLERKVILAILISGFGAGFLFLSPNFTGNVIGNLTKTNSNIIGAVLLFIALIGGFFWVKSKR